MGRRLYNTSGVNRFKFLPCCTLCLNPASLSACRDPEKSDCSYLQREMISTVVQCMAQVDYWPFQYEDGFLGHGYEKPSNLPLNACLTHGVNVTRGAEGRVGVECLWKNQCYQLQVICLCHGHQNYSIGYHLLLCCRGAAVEQLKWFWSRCLQEECYIAEGTVAPCGWGSHLCSCGSQLPLHDHPVQWHVQMSVHRLEKSMRKITRCLECLPAQHCECLDVL
jgi:hypothetical protein